MSERIEADYLIETAFAPQHAAEVMAGEQSSGTFLPVPGETPELKERSAARVERVEIIGEVASPSLPGAKRPKGEADAPIQQARVTLSWPEGNVGPSLPNLLATLAGNLFELGEFSGLRLLDLRLTRAFASAYHGPKFGVAGTRKLAGAPKGPLIGTIIKPSIGLSAEETAALVDELCEAGAEVLAQVPAAGSGWSAPTTVLRAGAENAGLFAASTWIVDADERVVQVMRVINRHADRTGKKVMFAFNLTGDLDQMRRRHDLVLEHGGTCIMASIHSVGLTGFVELAKHTALPVHAHRNGWGYLTRAPALGFDYPAWMKIWRLAGADHMHVNGIGNKFSEPDDSVVRSARAAAEPLFDDKPCTVMPVFSSGQTVRQARATFDAVGGDDLIYAAGGGIMAHPSGPGAGVLSLREAWEAAMTGIDISEHAKTHEALRQALGAFK